MDEIISRKGKIIRQTVEVDANGVKRIREEVLSEPAPSAQDDTDAMLVDHEYRLTLLELGVE